MVLFIASSFSGLYGTEWLGPMIYPPFGSAISSILFLTSATTSSAVAKSLSGTLCVVVYGEVAKGFGFENLQCFSKCFKKYFSVSPIKYRKT